jgi:hypothetical protein
MEKKGRFTVEPNKFNLKEILEKPYFPTENEIRRVGRFTILPDENTESATNEESILLRHLYNNIKSEPERLSFIRRIQRLTPQDRLQFVANYKNYLMEKTYINSLYKTIKSNNPSEATNLDKLIEQIKLDIIYDRMLNLHLFEKDKSLESDYNNKKYRQMYEKVTAIMNSNQKLILDLLLMDTELAMLDAINNGEIAIDKSRFAILRAGNLDTVDGGSRKGRKYHNKPMRNLTKKI